MRIIKSITIMKQKSKRVKLSAATIVLIVLAFTANAQYVIPVKERADLLKQRTLAVLLFDKENAELATYNEAIKKAYTEEWKITPVEFIYKEQFDEIVKSGNTKYAVVYSNNALNTLTFIHILERDLILKRTGDTLKLKTFKFSHYDVYLSLVSGPSGKLDNVTLISFANDELIPSDFFFAAQQFSLLVNASLNGNRGKTFYDPEKNIEYIKSKTLLLPYEFFDGEDLAKLSDKYEFPYKVSGFYELNEIVLAKNEDFVYPKIIWSDQHDLYGWVIVSAKDGSLRSFMSFGGIKTGSNQKAEEIIKPGRLKDALSKFLQKANSRYD